MAYESPIQVLLTNLETQLEGEILTATRKVGVHVDRDELIRALKYDRDQYQKGYRDGQSETAMLSRLYRWSDDHGGGLVIASSVEEAREKLVARYSRYNRTDNFVIWKATDDDYYDPDHPDVLDVY